ncbi:tRNA (adenosine(37)-N6)-dimethylallyltransferase MiaA [Candidatus Uhrbacteria bacterium]|nr:tRNA (adenosine(37)-N6)-dimethylallyltransferase MiaA [Candidatus Uhrbacteria bacterium]
MQKIIVIVGPTSSGKTKLAVDLARRFNGEIVSADSRQVYRGMDIGTGKELRAYGKGHRAVRHHLIDVVSPKTNFTLAQYQKRAYRAIEDILGRGKLPILVGGTGLYVQAVVDGYVLPDAPPDFKLRARLARLSTKKLSAKLKKLDPATYRVIDKNNRRRLERAIEICLATGVPLSKQREKHAPSYKVLMIGLAVPRDVLNKRIDARLKARLKQGLMGEAMRLHRQGISWKRLESFGLEYRYMSHYLRRLQSKKRPSNSHDRENLTTMVDALSHAIKDFSRRQMTWFRRDKRIVWVRSKKEAARLVKKFSM